MLAQDAVPADKRPSIPIPRESTFGDPLEALSPHPRCTVAHHLAWPPERGGALSLSDAGILPEALRAAIRRSISLSLIRFALFVDWSKNGTDWEMEMQSRGSQTRFPFSPTPLLP